MRAHCKSRAWVGEKGCSAPRTKLRDKQKKKSLKKFLVSYIYILKASPLSSNQHADLARGKPQAPIVWGRETYSAGSAQFSRSKVIVKGINAALARCRYKLQEV